MQAAGGRAVAAARRTLVSDLTSRWFHGPDGWEPVERAFDFREGGREVAAGQVPGELKQLEATL